MTASPVQSKTVVRRLDLLNAANVERRGQVAGVLLLTYLVAWVLEGALRRWVLPGQQELVYFLRVPIVVAIVGNALRFRNGRMPPAGAAAGAVIAALVVFDAYHVSVDGAPITTSILGLRLYVEPWLVPLCLGPDLGKRAVQRALRLVCALTVPLSILALIQVNSPRTAFLNRIFAVDGSDNFGLVAGSIRATSTFSSSAGHAIFSLLAVAAAVGLYLSPHARRDVLLSVTGGLSAAVMVVTAGSRTAVLGALLPLLVLLVAVGYRNPGRVPRLVVGTVTAGVAGWFLGKAIAPQQIQGIIERFTYTGADSELNSRSIGAYTDWIGHLTSVPLDGVGLAGQSQGLTNFGTAGATVEGELIRQLFELGPPVFLAALVLRVAVCLYLVRGSFRCLREGNLVPIVLLSVGFSTISAGPATGQGTICGYVAIVSTLLIAGFQSDPSGRGEQLPIEPRVLHR